MNKNLLLLGLFVFLLVSPIVLANVAYPITWITVPLYPFIILVEGFVFWLLAKNWIKVKLGFWKAILIVLIANLITSLVGTFLAGALYGYAIEGSLILLIAFILSVAIEWRILIFLFRKMKSLKKIKISDKKLFYVSLYVNIASYLPIILLFGAA